MAVQQISSFQTLRKSFCQLQRLLVFDVESNLVSLSPRMGKFKDLCKQLVRGKKPAPTKGSNEEDRKESQQSKQRRRLVKRFRQSLSPPRTGDSKPPAAQEHTEPVTPQKPCVNPLKGHTGQLAKTTSPSPVTPPNSGRPPSAQQSSSGQSSTWADSPFGRGIPSSSSSYSVPEDGPSAFVCELPASFTFDNAPAQNADESTVSTNVTRQEEAKHWGVSTFIAVHASTRLSGVRILLLAFTGSSWKTPSTSSL
ncbi:MAG: hypothetical protein Q9225_005189 [Loekoesia sp. 1 TL-2023]